MKPPRPFTPRLQNASGWLLRRSKPGRKEYDYRKLFYHYADPPCSTSAVRYRGRQKTIITMGIDELCALPVADLAAPDSALFLWATFPQLPEALRLIEAWGFRYKSVAFVWLKKE